MAQRNFSDFGYIVDSCPGNKTEYTDSATRLGCGVDENGRSQYVCVSNDRRSGLVEFCHNSTNEFYPKGNCIEVYESGYLDRTSCLHFTDGCPDNNFFLSDLYKFPACQRVNPQERCFFADPSCPNITTTEGPLPEDTSAPIGATSEGPLPGDDSAPIGAIVGSLVLVVCIVLLVLIKVVMWRRKQRFKRNIEIRETVVNVEGREGFVNQSMKRQLEEIMIEGLYQNPIKSSILCTILMTENYKISADAIEEKNTEVVKAFPSLCHKELDLFLETIEEMEKRDQSLAVEIENNVIGFKSEEVRHQVMCYFVTNCLETNEDFERYVNLSSVDSLLEYARTWWYVKGENERCLFLPNKMEVALIEALGFDAIGHVMVEKRSYIDSHVSAEIRKKVIMNGNI